MSHNDEPSDSLCIQFSQLEQQRYASSLGMWVFLATEVLFFGGMFLAYLVYRMTYPEVFKHAGKELNLTLGTVNTVLLLTSSYFMALAVYFSKLKNIRKAVGFLGGTWGLGFLFLIIKGYEYHDDFARGIVPWLKDTDNLATLHSETNITQLLYFLYYGMTGVHALHLTIGLGVIGFLLLKLLSKSHFQNSSHKVEIAGLYWHFVDIVWIFIYPLFYLMDRHP